MIGVILSGGSGTRLWPVSRVGRPKPFMKLSDGESLLGKTLARTLAVPGLSQVLTVTNRDYFFQTRDEYQTVNGAPALDYLLEPEGRNTGPAVALAALHVAEAKGGDAVLLVLPADHLVSDSAAFVRAVQSAEELAKAGKLVTFGIRPTRPDTGFGYIETGGGLPEHPGGHSVVRFVEKPDVECARAYVEGGRHLWNAGMFCFRADAILAAMAQTAPDLYQAAVDCWQATNRANQPISLDAATFAAMPGISIDYAVMERAGNIAVVPADFGWSDIGSWSAVSDLVPASDGGNRLDGEAVFVDSRNCYVQSRERMVAALGVEDLVIVDTADALLVADRNRAQDVRSVVEALKHAGHESYHSHRTVHRPWGSYTVLEEGDRFKIKRIMVKPRQALSLQLHHRRHEHWVVVSGTATVGDGNTDRTVKVNESTFIPVETPHRLINLTEDELVIIEVQIGDYLGEDDIVRFDDRYGRIE